MSFLCVLYMPLGGTIYIRLIKSKEQYIQKVLSLIKSKDSRGETTLLFSLTTNATVLTVEKLSLKPFEGMHFKHKQCVYLRIGDKYKKVRENT